MIAVHLRRDRISTPVSPTVVFLLGLNLRPAVTSVGSALREVESAPGMGAAIAAVLVAIPLWAIGIGGLLAPWLWSIWGAQRTVTGSLVVLTASLAVRVVGGPVSLLVGTALGCLAIAQIGTVLPVLVRGRSGTFSAFHTLALGCGSTAGALITPPVVDLLSWQFGLGVWAVLAVVTVRIWQRRSGPLVTSGKRVLGSSTLSRSVTAWALTVYFGLISTVTFLVMGWLPAILRDAGLSASAAGSCLALAMAVGLPMMWLVPLWARRWRSQPLLVAVLVLPTMAGIAGLYFVPAVLPWLWATGLGIGMGGVALALTSIPLRAGDDPEVATALSAMVQGGGYLIAGVGALACGLFHSISLTWHGPLILVFIILCGQAAAGLLAVRPVLARPAVRSRLQVRLVAGPGMRRF